MKKEGSYIERREMCNTEVREEGRLYREDCLWKNMGRSWIQLGLLLTLPGFRKYPRDYFSSSPDSLSSLIGNTREHPENRARKMSQKDEPQDKAYLVRIICFILGLGTLLPWNFFITAIPYFHGRLYGNGNSSVNGTSSDSNNQKDDLNFNNWMSLLAQLPLLLCTLLNSFIYQCISERIRIAGSMLAILSLFIFTAVLVKVMMAAQTFFNLTLATIWFINAFCAILQGSLFGLLTLFPQQYSSIFLSGQGMAGMFAALAMILSMSSGADNETVALCYFITPCIGTAISIICYFLLPRLDFAQYHLSKSNTNSAKSYEMETKTELLHPGEENGDAGQKKAGLLLTEAEAGCVGEEKPTVSICTILKKIWVMALTIVLTFGVTLSVFPAITAKVNTNVKDNETWSRFFTPVCCFLIFNAMDWIGRSITSKILWPGPDCKYIPLLAASRFIFVPLFMFCNIDDRQYLSTFFYSDAWFIIFMLLFSVSNGYFVSLPMCLAPKKVLPHESETTGALMTFFLALGLSVGAGLSFGFKELL